MIRPLKYSWYLLAFFLIASTPMLAQFSEADLKAEADALFEQGEYADAMPKYAQLLSLNSTSPEFNYKYGATALYGDADKKEEAIKFLRYASTKNGIDTRCWYFLGRAYHLNYQFADAIEAYQKFLDVGNKKDAEGLFVEQEIESCRNGQNLLSNIKEVVVLEKKQTQADAFFRVYDLTDIGGKILVTPEELLSPLDIKNNHKSLIHFRGTGTVVYYSSYGKDGKTGLDIYRASVLPNGEFSEPQKLGGHVNTDFDEDYPFMHPDEKTFFFSSKGHSSMGGYDIFRSQYDNNLDVFGPPENLDFAVNTPDNELFYIADSAMNLANFTSARSSEQGELHVYRVKVNSAPVDLTLIKGTFDNKVDPRDKLAKITVIDVSNNREIDVQYTDPTSGDYLLSFPRSGKFKFLVEANNSEQIHAGLVEIPASTGVNAYLQEMDLVMSGASEKLLINNLFDQKYDGDVAELAQKLLKQKAKLDVNFDPVFDDEPIDEPVVEDLANAPVAAGYSAGMTAENILEKSEIRAIELGEKADNVNYLRLGAVQTYHNKLAQADESSRKAEELTKSAESKTGDEADKLMFEASMAKLRAEAFIREAKNAQVLSEDLQKFEEEARIRADEAEKNYENLKGAVEANDYNSLVQALKEEYTMDHSEVYDSKAYNALVVTERASIDSKKEAQTFLDRAASIRSESENVQAQLMTKRTQLKKAKGKSAKELEAEVARLELEYKDLDASASRSYERAEQFEQNALNRRQQHEIVKDLSDQLVEGELDPSALDPSLTTEGEGLKPINERIDDLSIDEEAVASYVAANPDVLNGIGSEAQVMAYKRTYLGDNSEDLAVNSDQETESSDLQNEATSDEGNDPESIESNNDGVQTSSDVAVAGADESSEPSNANSQEASVPTAELTESEAAEAENTADDESAPMALEEYDGYTTNEKIQAEYVAIQSARDWIEIIDNSIVDIESQENPSDSDQEQLDQYKELKAQKLDEISRREDRIRTWEGEGLALESTGEEAQPEQELDVDTIESEASENPIADDASSQSKVESEHLSIAESDVDGLDVAYITRLESKVDRTYSDLRYMGRINKVDSSYLDDMAAIETSGKSHAEIAAEKQERTSQLIAGIDREMANPTLSTDQKEMLLEVRRIKVLELRNDREVEAGRIAYEPLTTEGKEARAEQVAYEAENPAFDPEEYPELSPKMQADLSMDFTRSVVLAGYDERIEKIESANSEKRMKEARLELNEEFVQSLQDEIQLYSEAVKSTDSEGVSPISVRYEKLLSERSRVIDEINSDKTYLAFEEAAAIAEGRVEADVLDRNIEAELDSIHKAQVAEVKERNLSESEELEALSAANLEQAELIDTEVAGLITELDEAVSESRRDALQIEIQKLDAVAADHRQEADRLLSESQAMEATLVAESDETEASPNVEIDGESRDSQEVSEPVAVLNDDEVKTVSEQIDSDPIQIESLSFKSLNANIVLDGMKGDLSIYQEKRDEAAAKVEAYNATNDEAEKAKLSNEIRLLSEDIEERESAIVEQIEKAHAPEISYFKESNQDLQSRSNELIANGNGSEEELDEIQSRNQELIEKLNRIELSFKSGEIDEVERIQQEQEVLTELAVANAEYTDRVENVEKAIAEDIAQNEELSDGEEETTADTPESISVSYSEVIPAGVQAVVSNPELRNPKGSQEYISPVLEEVESSMTEAKKDEYIAEDERLQVNTSFAETNESEPVLEMLEGNTQIDARGLELLSSTPNQLNYVLASVRADSLKKIEKAQSDYSSLLMETALSELEELKTLREKGATDRKEVKRMEELEVSAIDHYERAAIAARVAEDARVLRKNQEKLVAESLNSISPEQKAELDAILRNEAYHIIPSDLASTEPSSTSPESNASISNDSNDIDSESTTDVAENSAEDSGKGNWLMTVDVIAEKDNFSDVSDQMFIEVDRAAYSDERPIPIDPVMPDGLIFQVQIGAFRNPIPQDHFAQFAPVMGQKLDNGITRYRAGIFRVYKEALDARDLIREKGYSDAFVVVYLDGEKLTGPQARDILAQVRASQSNSESSASNSNTGNALAESSDSTRDDVNQEPAQTADGSYYNDPEAAVAEQVELTPGLFYTVQVGVYSKPVKLDALFNLDNLNSELTPSGYIRYTTGRFANVADAVNQKAKAREKGVSDAFVTAYFNGKRISLTEAQSILDDQGESAVSPVVTGYESNVSSEDTNSADAVDNSVKYVVIVGMFAGDIPQDLANIFLEREDLRIRRVDGPSGGSIYVSPEYDTEQEAQDFLDILYTLGINTAMMGQMKDGSIIGL